MSIFNGQSLLTIELDTSYDISAATSAKILYKKPDGTTGEFVGVVSDTTKVSYTVDVGDIDQDGTWVMQALVVIGGLSGYGNKAFVTVESSLG